MMPGNLKGDQSMSQFEKTVLRLLIMILRTQLWGNTIGRSVIYLDYAREVAKEVRDS